MSTSKFSASPAPLLVTVHSQPEEAYKRTQKVVAEFVILYPDSSPVVSIKEGLEPVTFYAGQFKRANLGLVATDTTSGIWAAERKIQINATLDTNYRFVITANAFDDGYGNTGPDSDVETGSFTVVPATLQVSIALNSTHYQVPFETMTAYAQANYPDGLTVANATAQALLSHANSKMNGTVTYDKSAATWIVKYTFSLRDLPRPGTWSLSVEVRDIYGNAGSASVEVIAELHTFLEAVLVAILAVVVGRWFLSRYGRRLYLRAKRISSTVRERMRSPSLGR